MKIRQLLQVLPVIFFLLGTSRGFSSELIREEMQSGSFNREYFVHVPPSYRKDRPTPVVFVFHGGGGNAKQIAKFSDFNKLSEKHRFLAI